MGTWQELESILLKWNPSQPRDANGRWTGNAAIIVGGRVEQIKAGQRSSMIATPHGTSIVAAYTSGRWLYESDDIFGGRPIVERRLNVQPILDARDKRKVVEEAEKDSKLLTSRGVTRTAMVDYYASTQAELESKGVQSMTLYRGVHKGHHIQELDMLPVKDGKLDVPMGTLNSWTTSKEIATMVAERHPMGYILRAEVPREHIFASHTVDPVAFRGVYAYQKEVIVYSPDRKMLLPVGDVRPRQ